MISLTRPLAVAACAAALWIALPIERAAAEEASPQAFVRKMEALLKVDGQPKGVLAAFRAKQAKHVGEKRWAVSFMNLAERMTQEGHEAGAREVLVAVGEHQAALLNEKERARFIHLIAHTLSRGESITTPLGVVVATGGRGKDNSVSPQEERIRARYDKIDDWAFQSLDKAKQQEILKQLYSEITPASDAVLNGLIKVVLRSSGPSGSFAAQHLVAAAGERALPAAERILAQGDLRAQGRILHAVRIAYPEDSNGTLIAWTKKISPRLDSTLRTSMWLSLIHMRVHEPKLLMALYHDATSYSDAAFKKGVRDRAPEMIQEARRLLASEDFDRKKLATEALLRHGRGLEWLPTLSADELQSMLDVLAQEGGGTPKPSGQLLSLTQELLRHGGELAKRNGELLWRASVPFDLEMRTVPAVGQGSPLARNKSASGRLRARIADHLPIPPSLMQDDEWFDNYITQRHSYEEQTAYERLARSDGFAERVTARIKALPPRWRSVAIGFIARMLEHDANVLASLPWGDLFFLEGSGFPDEYLSRQYTTICKRGDESLYKRIVEVVPTLSLENARILTIALAARDDAQTVKQLESWIHERKPSIGVRRAFVAPLGDMTCPESTALLQTLVGDFRGPWAPAAIRALGDQGRAPALDTLFGHATPHVETLHSSVVAALIDCARRNLIPSSIPFLLRIYQNSAFNKEAAQVIDAMKVHRERLDAANRMAVGIDVTKIVALVNMLDAEDPATRRTGVLALVGMKATNVIPRLAAMATEDPDAEVRRVAIRGLEILSGVMTANSKMKPEEK